MTFGTVKFVAAALGLMLLTTGCRTPPGPPGVVPSAAPIAAPPRTDDVIIVAGERFHTGTRVVTWLEHGGYNAYRGVAEYPPRQSAVLSAEEAARVKDRGWDLPTLQKVVDQFVLHYDAAGLSSVCFEVLQRSGLSVHFMLDVDGTIYQTLDLKERAAHATVSNSRSIGIEIANIGAYPPNEAAPLGEWYGRDAEGGVAITVPKKVAAPRIRTPHFTGRPMRPAPVRGVVQRKPLVQYDFTPEQYAALVKLTAALCGIFPRLVCDVPRDANGAVLAEKMTDEKLANYRGILGHYHIQENKVDPGPAFQWERLLQEIPLAGQ